jgi:hypothetical protein
MTPILSTVIKSDNGTTDAGRIRAYLDDLIESLPALMPYRYAEVDPDFGTGRLIGEAAAPLLDGADDDEANTTKD